MKKLICKKTGKPIEMDFYQLRECINCNQAKDCEVVRFIFKGTPIRRQGMVSGK